VAKMKYRKFIKVFDLNNGVIKSKHLSDAQIKIYGYIHSWWENHQTGNREGYETIAANCDVARSTFALAIKRLESLGWISVIHGARIDYTKNECNTYQINRMPEAHIKHTKKLLVSKNNVIDKAEKSEFQKKRDKKYAMLAMAKDTFTPEEYQELKKHLDI
jgi:predicted transcriptional regulator